MSYRVPLLGLVLGVAAVVPGGALQADRQVFDGAATSRTIRISAADAVRHAALAREQTPVELAGGLELSLWASEALRIVDPVAIDVDARGRAWVTSHRGCTGCATATETRSSRRVRRSARGTTRTRRLADDASRAVRLASLSALQRLRITDTNDLRGGAPGDPDPAWRRAALRAIDAAATLR